MKLQNLKMSHLLTAILSTMALAVSVSPAPAEEAVQPDWVKQYEAQLSREDDVEGRTGLTQKIDEAMVKVMREVAKGNEMLPAHDESGMFNRVSMMQQMDRSYFLGPASANETVTAGGHCPAGVPVKAYDISAINVEITLNQWLDFHPGYMYVLTENIQKVRDEEKKNAEEVGIQVYSRPMLPWISENKTALSSILVLINQPNQRFYVHCYLGQHRANLVRRMAGFGSSPGEAGRTSRSTKCVCTRRSAKNRRAARVSLRPKPSVPSATYLRGT